MITRPISLLVPALGLAFAVTAGCSSSSEITETTNPFQHDGPSVAYHQARNIPAHGVALEGYCPVAYFAANKPVRGSGEFPSTYEGITYHFVNAEAKQAFDANPSKYIPAFGGWCAFGMSVEDKFPVDPRNFKIVDGQLMVFLKNPSVDARDLWNNGDEAELTAKAAAHWRKVQG